MLNDGKVLITGASGFIGANLVRYLAENGCDLKLFLRKGSDHPYIKNFQCEKFYGNLVSYEQVKDAVRECNYIYHLAAFVSFSKHDFQKAFENNVTVTQNVIRAALENDVKRVVYVSAGAAIGEAKKTPIVMNESEEFIPNKNDVYAYTKYLAEKEVLKGVQEGLNAVIVNSSTVYGQGDFKLNSGTLIKNIDQSKVKFAFPGGTSIISVDDVISGIVLAMEKGETGERYILNSENISYFELFNRIAKVLDRDAIKIKLPSVSYYLFFIAFLGVEAIFNILNKKNTFLNVNILKGFFRFKYYDNKKAIDKLIWKPEVKLEDAVKKALSFYKEEDLL